MKEKMTGRVTIPTDMDVVPQTLELMKRWGADAIRDCDAADRELPEAAKPEADRPPDDAPAGKEGEKKQKIRAIAIALAIVVIAFACVWFAAENKKADEADNQGDNVRYDVVEMPDQNENGFDFAWEE